MSLPLVFVICLIAAGIAFLVGWLCAKVHFSERPGDELPADTGPSVAQDDSLDDANASSATPAAHEEHDRILAQVEQLKAKLNEQAQLIANITEDRDRIRVEHGTQQRMINSLESSKFDRDKAQLQFNKHKKLWHHETRKLTEQIESLEAKLKLAVRAQTTRQNAPLPTGVADGASADVRSELAAGKEKITSLTAQLEALQEWARPLAKENDQFRELLERMKSQIMAMRNDRKQAELSISELTAQLAATSELLEQAAETKARALAEESAQRSHTATDNVPHTAQGAQHQSDPLEETHTDLETPDDLQQLPGIGPSLEKKLNGEGIFHYEQIAGLSIDDLTSLTKRLAARTSRAKRNAWPEEARRLLSSKNNQPDQPGTAQLNA